MSLDIQADNTGLAFENGFKGDNAKAPDYKGSVMINGELYDIAMWAKELGGKLAYSLAFQEPYKGSKREESTRGTAGKPASRSSGGSKPLAPRAKPSRR